MFGYLGEHLRLHSANQGSQRVIALKCDARQPIGGDDAGTPGAGGSVRILLMFQAA